VATAGREEIRTAHAAALGCNLAWGLVDAFMDLTRTLTDRRRTLALVHGVRAADAEAGRKLIADALPEGVAKLVSRPEVEAMRGRLLALPDAPAKPSLNGTDFVAAFGIFLIVVASTFPVVLPNMFIDDVALAKNVSRVTSLTMLLLGGLALGRYAGYGSWKAGVAMAVLGTLVLAAAIALGG
jgi:VIT1/CCC1 family predicted Fe2+/Mn2+ transporter